MKNLNKESGVTLVEILIGVVISMIMMAAMFTSYNAVNNSYSQVIDRAKISQNGRDLLGMLVKDIRLAGFRYFDDVSKTPTDYVPILITKASGSGCDKIEITYGDRIRDPKQPNVKPAVFLYRTYKIIYECKQSNIVDKKTKTKISAYAIYKSKYLWNGSSWTAPSQSTDDLIYKDELVVDYVQELIFIPIDNKGKTMVPVPKTLTESNKIKVVDIMLSLRSQGEFFREEKDLSFRSLGQKSNKSFKDKYLREALIVSAHTRNMGL
tara:strand:+ start:756 stop:1553 length:798 start_codon:yes stop_codon:yes gene_type:complete